MTRNPYYSGPASDHFDGTRFFNPGQPSTDRSFKDLWRWRKETRAEWPEHVPVVPAMPEKRVAGCRATMIGHASVLIQVGGLNLLTDPVWSERASPVSFAGPKRVTQPGIRFGDLPPIDVVLLSHNHYDHCDLKTLKRLVDRHDPLIVTPLGNDRLLARTLPASNIVAGDWGDTIDLPAAEPGASPAGSVAIVPAQHWSRRGIRDTRMCLWCGFVLKIAGRSIYFAGDSGYGDGKIFREIREAHGSPDLALIPIGAYDPRWFMAPQHMNPEEAVKVFQDVGASRAVAIHWGTIQLTNEPRDEPAALLRRALADRQLDESAFIAAKPGEIVEIDPRESV
ncbi:MBL fold metallo-hydrolase [Jiella mangrovi]|uniref:MBL fold metallo-hydrolase n=1 Tax=Jiella mangrovi TaxID=2821407 RepID=UPI003158BA1B